jgi:hypothetical protein
VTNIVKVSCFTLALIAAIAYVLMGVGALKPGNLSSDNMPAFYYIIPAGYVAMGAAVFLKKRWLLITDAALAAFTIMVFYAKYASQPDVLWSAPGLITKIAQVLMLAGLIYLIIYFRPEKSLAEAK